MSPVTSKIEKATASLIWKQPFIASLLLQIEKREDPTCETAWINGLEIGYNPVFMAGLDHEQTTAIFAHEIMHVACLHHTRRNGRDSELWNTACDYAANNLLQDSGFNLAGLTDLVGEYAGKSAEEIYAALDAKNQGQGKGPDKKPGLGEVRDFPGPAPEVKAQEDKIKVQLSQAMAAHAKFSPFPLPDALALAVQETQEPRLDWREVLARFMDEQARSDYSFSRPNPRYLASGFSLPVIDSRELSTVHLAVDTSGSISPAALAAMVAEVQSLLGLYAAQGRSPELSVVYCDTQIRGAETLSPGDQAHPVGGGCTDFRPPFAHLEAQGDTPKALIYLTDGRCSRFPADPGYPVIWALTARNRSFSPPFGEIITMD